jgi:hypothetical protein
MSMELKIATRGGPPALAQAETARSPAVAPGPVPADIIAIVR